VSPGACAPRGGSSKPVSISGRQIATTFWSKAWCQHIGTFSDYANRLPRGRSYALNGSVVDLQIQPGQVRALVSGSQLYEAKVDIVPLAAARWRALVGQCSGQIDSVISLLTGKLSDEVMTLLCHPEQGVFPEARQIEMSCSCPDYAALSKHLAAVLYGIGARLDSQPELFFVLRGVDQMDLVAKAGSSAGSGPDELAGADLAELFGIALQVARRLKRKTAKRGTARRKSRRSRRR
jgi:uncharacterized Zn finger protein